MTQDRSGRVGICALAAAAGLLAAAFAGPALATGQYVADNTPSFVASAKRIGTTSPSVTLTVGLWLRPRNMSALDMLAVALYDPASAQYRHWLTRSEVLARFAPAAADIRVVRDFLKKSGLAAVSEGPGGFYIRAQGTAAQLEKTFHVTIDDYEVGGRILRANTGNPYIEGPAAIRVQAVSGLDGATFLRTLKLQPVSARATSCTSFCVYPPSTPSV